MLYHCHIKLAVLDVRALLVYRRGRRRSASVLLPGLRLQKAFKDSWQSLKAVGSTSYQPQRIFPPFFFVLFFFTSLCVCAWAFCFNPKPKLEEWVCCYYGSLPSSSSVCLPLSLSSQFCLHALLLLLSLFFFSLSTYRPPPRLLWGCRLNSCTVQSMWCKRSCKLFSNFHVRFSPLSSPVKWYESILSAL